MFEILYLYYVQTECPEEKQKFENMLKKRLERPFKQSKRDYRRIGDALDERELAIVAQNGEDQLQKIQNLLSYTLECYNTVITRLVKYEPLFQK